ncbi:tetraacyldisaccharide 4'-kinase [compost metagenome]
MLPTDMVAADPDLLEVFGDLPVFIARLEPAAPPPPGPQVGFAGIAKPWKLERSLIAAGCDLKDFVPFPDHAALSDRDFAFLNDRAAVYDAGLVTTEKDWVRLTPEQRAAVAAWPVAARFEDETGFTAFLMRAV